MESGDPDWSRIIITSVNPQVDGGRWPIRRSAGESVEVVAGVIADGHDTLAVELHVEHEDGEADILRLELRHNDEYAGSFQALKLGKYTYRVRAWVDRFATWQEEFGRRVKGEAQESELRVELLSGASLLREVSGHADEEDSRILLARAASFEKGVVDAGLDSNLAQICRRHDPGRNPAWSPALALEVDTPLAGFAAWYEFFPRSTGGDADGPGTLDTAAKRLEGIRSMGFDVVYLPPVHPIGSTFRKGKDNSPVAEPGDPGSPWAIGSADGGHRSVHPDLGGLDAFDRFVARATELGLKVAIDIAFQCSPDHAYVRQHPEWFNKRADGSIRYAENPPKKYQDVYPFDFGCSDHAALWNELRDVFTFWIDRGVRIFRVDNPHTKPFAFWQWCLDELKRQHKDLVFLAEAFSRPKTMYALAKLGFNNSYTYFTWRNTRQELEAYLTELTQSEAAEYFRPSFWPNTPDILHDYLAQGGRAAHLIRFALAATLASVYGVYGPPFEHVRNLQHPVREEYRDNEKYEIRTWNWNDPSSLQPFFRRINRIRRENGALQSMRSLRFLPVDNPRIIAYSKERGDNMVVCVVSLDPFQVQEGTVELASSGLGTQHQLHDQVGGERFLLHGSSHFVRLDPGVMPLRVYRVLRRLRTEADFGYYA